MPECNQDCQNCPYFMDVSNDPDNAYFDCMFVDPHDMDDN